MKRTLIPLVAISLCVACSNGEQQARELDTQADTQLGSGQISAAHAGYLQALDADSSDAHAAAGAAVTGLFGLPDSQPVTSLLDQCGQPHFDVEHTIFGPDGVLAQAALARSGTAQLQAKTQSEPGAAFVAAAFTPDRVRAIDEGAFISIEAKARDVNGDVRILLNPADLYSNDAVATPLVDGTSIDLAEHPEVDFSAAIGGVAGDSYLGASGTLVFHGTPTVGSAIAIELQGVTVHDCSGAAPCGSAVQLDGEIKSTITSPVGIPEDKVPFASAWDEAHALREQLLGTVDACGASLSADEIVEHVAALMPALDEIRGQLDTAIAGPATGTFALPKSLLHTREDLALNQTDLLALRSAVHAARAAIALATRYHYLQTPFAQLVGNRQEWTYDSLSSSYQLTSVRDFLLQPTADDLNANFLTVNGGQDLGVTRAELQSALADLVEALSNPTSAAGVLDLDNSRSAAFASQLLDQVKAVRASLDGPQTLPRNPGYGVNLQAFFAAPPDRQVILERAGLTELFTFVAGDADAQTNDRIDAALPESAAEFATWSGGTISVPVDGRTTTCLADEDCPTGNLCGATGACFPKGLRLVDSSAELDAIDDLLSPAAADLRDLLDF